MQFIFNFSGFTFSPKIGDLVTNGTGIGIVTDVSSDAPVYTITINAVGGGSQSYTSYQNPPMTGDVVDNPITGASGIVTAVAAGICASLTISDNSGYDGWGIGDTISDVESAGVLDFQNDTNGLLQFQNDLGENLYFTVGIGSSTIGIVLNVYNVQPSELNVEQTIISQYANSPIILALIGNFESAENPAKYLDDFYNNVWNIDTATGWGRDNWGRIIGVTRVITIPAGSVYGNFGFAQQAGAETFKFGAFYNGSNLPTTQVTLTDAAYRRLLMMKAYANITDGSIQSLNKLLMYFSNGRGNAYVSNLGGMQMRLTFEFILQPWELSLLENGNVFPAPCGVGISIIEYVPRSTFGFSQQTDANTFKFGSFYRSI